jgi:sortase B
MTDYQGEENKQHKPDGADPPDQPGDERGMAGGQDMATDLVDTDIEGAKHLGGPLDPDLYERQNSGRHMRLADQEEGSGDDDGDADDEAAADDDDDAEDDAGAEDDAATDADAADADADGQAEEPAAWPTASVAAEAAVKAEAEPTVIVKGVGQKKGGMQRYSHSSSPRRNQLPLNALLWVGIALILIAVSIAGYLLWRHFSALSDYKHLEIVSGLDPSQLDDPTYIPNTEDLNINWDALRAINPDIVGWVYVPGTRLSYPIVQGQDNSYYLNHTADGNVNASGAIFLDYENSRDFGDISNYVYGHNMLGKTMFSEMTGYVDEAFIREHPRIMIFTPDKTYDLTVIGAIRCAGTDPVRRIFFSDVGDFKGFLNELGGFLASGKFDSLAGADNIYCFSTCELFDFNSRVIVIATDSSRSLGAYGGDSRSPLLAVEASDE